MASCYPLSFMPVYKDYPWGGRRIPALLGRSASEGVYAESREISTHPDGESVVANGHHAGRMISEVLGVEGRRIQGNAVEGGTFPC